jgi:hypothetical protein
MIRWIAPILALALAAPAGAQQWQVARDRFAFAGSKLTIHVDVASEGSLTIIRGSAGAVDVAGRSDTGLTAAGLTPDEHLTLTAAGEGFVEYVLAVPERVWVSVRLPDRAGAESLGARQRTGTFRWGGTAHAPEPVTDWLPAGEPRLGAASAYTVYAADTAPHTVTLHDLTHVRSITVQVEGSSFRVTASRPLTLAAGDARHVEIRPGSPSLELAIAVPAATASFTLVASGTPALVVDGRGLSVHCGPSSRQSLPDNRRWVTFTPIQGALECQ